MNEPRTEDRGFTLVELMSVIAIVGVLAAVAVFYVRPSDYASSVKGYAEQIAALSDQARLRAMSTQRIQRLEVTEYSVTHWQATSPGMAAPAGWEEIVTINAPGIVRIAATDSRTHIDPDDAVPGDRVGLGATLDFKPDGSAAALTIFFHDDNDSRRVRLAVYGATGTARVFEGW